MNLTGDKLPSLIQTGDTAVMLKSGQEVTLSSQKVAGLSKHWGSALARVQQHVQQQCMRGLTTLQPLFSTIPLCLHHVFKLYC